jgi:hypothetical protein
VSSARRGTGTAFVHPHSRHSFKLRAAFATNWRTPRTRHCDETGLRARAECRGHRARSDCRQKRKQQWHRATMTSSARTGAESERARAVRGCGVDGTGPVWRAVTLDFVVGGGRCPPWGAVPALPAQQHGRVAPGPPWLLPGMPHRWQNPRAPGGLNRIGPVIAKRNRRLVESSYTAGRTSRAPAPLQNDPGLMSALLGIRSRDAGTRDIGTSSKSDEANPS